MAKIDSKFHVRCACVEGEGNNAMEVGRARGEVGEPGCDQVGPVGRPRAPMVTDWEEGGAGGLAGHLDAPPRRWAKPEIA